MNYMCFEGKCVREGDLFATGRISRVVCQEIATCCWTIEDSFVLVKQSLPKTITLLFPAAATHFGPPTLGLGIAASTLAFPNTAGKNRKRRVLFNQQQVSSSLSRPICVTF